MARDFSAAQGPRRGHVAVGGMALCSPGGAMWRWAAWLSAPPGGAMGRYISLRHGTLIFCAMSFASFMSFSSFSWLTPWAVHYVLCRKPRL